ncbi:MAG: hypothetical protein ACREFR_18795 [Limisphaerales bacterium]
MLATMIAWVNHYAPRLNLPFEVPVFRSEIQRCGAGHPLIAKLSSDPKRRAEQIKALRIQNPALGMVMCIYGAGIQISNCLISFPEGYDNTGFSNFTPLVHITKLEDDGMTSFGIPLLHLGEASNSLMERASRMKYTVTTNDLYAITTNYLRALDIDPKNNNGNRISIDMRPFHSNRGLVPNPIMTAHWESPSTRAAGDSIRFPGGTGVAFEISAVTGELLEMCAGDDCGCKELPLIKNFGALYAIPNAKFLQYSETERRNLVFQFAASRSLVTPEAMRLAMTLTTNPVVYAKARRGKIFLKGP